MVQYICERCGKSFKQKQDHERHMNRKFGCTRSESNRNNDHMGGNLIETLNNTINMLVGEIKTLKEKVNEIDTIKQGMMERVKEIDTIKKELEIVKNSKEIINNIDIIKRELEIVKNRKEIINNIETINILAYGKEDVSFLTDKEIRKLVMAGYQSIPKYVEMVHCNDDKPENKNIYIPSKKNINKVMVYNGSKWRLRSDCVVEELYDRGIEFVEGYFDELKEKKQIQPTAINRLQKVYNRMNKNNDNMKKKSIDEIKLILYNNRPA